LSFSFQKRFLAKIVDFVRIYLQTRLVRSSVIDWTIADWVAIHRRLVLIAESVRFASGLPEIFDGISAADLASEVLIAYFTSPTRLDFDESKGTLENFLCGVMRYKLIDHARRHQRMSDADVSHYSDDSVDVVVMLDHEKMLDYVRKKVKGDHPLEELVEAIGAIDDSTCINQQLAENMETNVSDVRNRRKRLTRLMDRLRGFGNGQRNGQRQPVR
jgi:DNA-directed RNA polymerase specialized sigma24 family protein